MNPYLLILLIALGTIAVVIGILEYHYRSNMDDPKYDLYRPYQPKKRNKNFFRRK
jgi:hypothetical protein